MRITGNKSGRVQLECEIDFTGSTLCVFLYGGKAHIGAISLCQPDGISECVELPGHREGNLARSLAVQLAKAAKCGVAVICGIHYNNISAREIAEVERLAAEIGESIARLLSKDNKQIQEKHK